MEESEGGSECFCDATKTTCPQDIIIMLDEDFVNFLEPHAIKYQEQNPHIRIRLERVDGGAAVLQEKLLEGRSSAGSSTMTVSTDDDAIKNIGVEWDAAIFPAQTVGAMVEADALWDLSNFVKQSEELEWTEILPFFRQRLAQYGTANMSDNGIRLIPLDGDVLNMYYRRDLFEEYNIQVPRTWNEYMDAAKFFHGKPLGPDGTLLFGSCVSRSERCANVFWASLLLSSMTQARGTSSGYFLNPETLEPLFGPAMETSLRFLAEQHKYGHSDELLGECLQSNYAFNEGNCALTYNWGNQMTISSIPFDIGVAPTPGSVAILDRTTNTLERCTEDICPHGTYYEDIGIVNHAPYSAFGGWAAGISKTSTQGKQYAAANFFAFVSNSQQSLGDILPNERSLFAQPYRYSHVESLNWIDGPGFDVEVASQYTSSIREISSDNSVLEIRMPLSAAFRQIVDEEVSAFMGQVDLDSDNTSLAQQVTSRLDQRIRDVITADDNLETTLLRSYRKSIGFSEIEANNIQNLIDEDYRHAGWGLAGLMCITSLLVIVWTLRNRNNRVMKAFQPFLLIQSAVGLFLLAATIIPLGFDDSWLSEDLLNITCMLIPWMYVTGFTIFFSSVYCKIRKCIQIYKEPKKYDVLKVEPGSAVRLNTRLFLMNGMVLTVWTLVDPLQWVRSEVEGGIVLEDGVVETYGVCMGSGWGALAFALILFFMNLAICCIATYQAFSCRFLVLEFNEMQWLPLSLFPFIEVWLMGAPIIALIYDDPTLLFVVTCMMITASTLTAGLAVFAPKDWYIRKFRDSKHRTNKKQVLPRDSSAGILVLKHPTVESQKQLEELQNQFQQIHSYNTELEIEIRTMKDRFKELNASQKYAVAQNLFGVTGTVDSREQRGVEEFEQTEISKSNDADLEAMEQFERVWKMPDEDYEDENDVVPIPVPPTRPIGLGSVGSPDDDDGAKVDKECAPTQSTSRTLMALNNSNLTHPGAHMTQQDDNSSSTSSVRPPSPSRSTTSASDKKDSGVDVSFNSVATNREMKSSGLLPNSPESNAVSIFEDQDSRDMSNTQSKSESTVVVKSSPPSPMADDPSRIEWFLNSCDSSDEDSDDQDPEKILEITRRALSLSANAGNEQKNDDNEEEKKEAHSEPKERKSQATKSTAPKEPSPSEEDPSRIEWFLNNCDSSDEESANEDPDKILEIAKRALASNPLYKQESNIEVAPHHDDFEEESEHESEDAVVKKKELRELGSMIKDDDLAALERKASMLAEALKAKLMVSHLADLSGDSGSTESKGRDKEFSRGFNDLDISKIGSEDGDTTRNFVVMSDSILESPAKNTSSQDDIGLSGINLLSPKNRFGVNDSDSESSSVPPHAPSAGESSSANMIMNFIMSGPNKPPASSPASSEQGHTTQDAGEPSQGDWRDRQQKPSKSYYSEDNESYPEVPPGEIGYGQQRSPKKLPAPKTLQFKPDPAYDDRDVSSNKSFSVADWSAVGNTASLLHDWSDSQSNSSYADSTYAESCSSLEATTRASALDTPLAKELDNLVSKLDWDGVKMAATKFETSVVEESFSLSIEEKKRKKRELEAWRTSISRSYSKSP